MKYIGPANVKTLKLPKRIAGHRVRVIGKNSLQNLTKLRKLVIPEGVYRVQDNAAFGDYNVRYLTLPSTLKSVGVFAFHGCNIKNLKLPNKLKTIGGQAFASTQRVTLPKSLKTFKWTWFASGDGTCTLSSIKVAKGSKYFSVKNGVLYNKNKTRLVYHLVSNWHSSFKVPNSVRTIAASAFSWSFGLEHVTLGNRVTTIEKGAFIGTPLKGTLTLPASVKKLGDSSLSCSNLNTLIVKSKKLTAKNIKNCLKGSSVTRVYVNVGTRAENEKYANKYRNIFDYYDYNNIRKYVYVYPY